MNKNSKVKYPKQHYRQVILGSIMLPVLCISAVFAGSVSPSRQQGSSHKLNREVSAQVIKTPVVSVQTQAVKEVTVEDSLQALGTLAPSQEVTLSFDAAGHITKINYKNGQYVKKGAIIAELNNASEKAELKSLLADAQVKALDYQRYLKLSKIGGVSEQMLDKEHASMVQAAAKVEGKKVELAQRQLVAPFTGFLGEFNINLGAYVGTGQAIVRLVAISPLKVAYSVPQGQKSKLLLGQSVNVKSDASNQLVSGLVQFISPTVNTDTGTIALEAEIQNKDYKLSPGMYVSVKQLLGNQHRVLIVPETAVSVNEKGASVYIVNNNIAHLVKVTLGSRDQGNVEVLTGLTADQQVVVAGTQKLKDGMSVKVIPAAPVSVEETATQLKLKSPAISSGKNQESKSDQENKKDNKTKNNNKQNGNASQSPQQKSSKREAVLALKGDKTIAKVTPQAPMSNQAKLTLDHQGHKTN
ncbi:efflux RND transporter periplasmic adaptor subunit [Piscirickettsia salmonis]|uniref:efflux RND transporter periplasmic adaptor subunit n=1 Tax=Piscirickettsia salmonis TaxID=1238 RepID=UPI0007C93577|nr:Multidrug resistance protein MdtA precursor [Piscirickettsiaceae bacterium NZ-RLO1]